MIQVTLEHHMISHDINEPKYTGHSDMQSRSNREAIRTLPVILCNDVERNESREKGASAAPFRSKYFDFPLRFHSSASLLKNPHTAVPAHKI